MNFLLRTQVSSFVLIFVPLQVDVKVKACRGKMTDHKELNSKCVSVTIRDEGVAAATEKTACKKQEEMTSFAQCVRT